MAEQEQQRLEEEMTVRYFKVVDFSTKAILKLVESMVRNTFRVLGFASPRDYCVRKLRWTKCEAEKLFSRDKAVSLSDSYAQSEYRLLLGFWMNLDKAVAKELEGLTALVQEAIHDPPASLSKHRLHKLIQTKVRPCLQKLTDAVRETCHTLLEKELLYLQQKRHRISSAFNRMERLNEKVCFSPLQRATLKFQMTYENMQAIRSVIPTSELNACELARLSRDVDSFSDVQKPTTKQILAIKTLDMELNKRSRLCDIIRQATNLADRDIDNYSLLSWEQDLQDLQQDFGGRLRVLGRSECASYRAVYREPPVDIIRWLCTKETKLEKINDNFWSLVDLRSNKEVLLEHLVEGSRRQRVVMLYGPPGSGKTCLCEYLQEKWCSGDSAHGPIRELQLLVVLKEKAVRHGSFKHHLKNVMFPRLLKWVPEAEVLASLCQFAVCYVMDSSAGCSPEFTSAVREVVSNLCHSTAIITKRLEARGEADARAATDEVYLHPLKGCRRKDLCLSYVKCLRDARDDLTKLSRLEPSVAAQNHYNASNRHNTERMYLPLEDPDVLADKFNEKLISEERDDLFYPLQLAYMLWLWLQDPRHLTKLTTVSQLFKKIFSLCEQVQDVSTASTLRLFHRIKFEKKRSGDESLRRLATLASNEFRYFGSKTLRETSRGAKHGLSGFTKHNLTTLSPFLEYDRDTMKWRFLHPFLVEVLFAWDMKCGFEQRKTLPHSSLVENSGSTYVTIIRLLGGFSSAERDKDKDLLNQAVKLFRAVGVADHDDLLAWLPLLREGAWSLSLRDVVKRELKTSKTRWSVPHANPREVQGVVLMVERRVFLPREVIIEAEAPAEVVGMLASHHSVDVRIYPRVDRGVRPRDALLHALRGAGNVVEFQGKLEERGASALAHMTRLRTLKLHLASLAALEVFSVSVKKLVLLDDLHLHLHLPFDTPVARIPRVQVVPRRVTVYFYLYGVTDSTCRWAAEVCKELKCHRNNKTEIYLSKSILSPDKLHDIKTELHPAGVHISR